MRFSETDKSRDFHCLTISLSTHVDHRPNKQPAKFDPKRVQEKKDIEVKQRHLEKRAKQGKNTFSRVAPRGLTVSRQIWNVAI